MEGRGVEGLGTGVGPTATLVGRPTPYAGPPPLLKARVEGRLAPLARARGGARHWRHLLSHAKRGRAVPQRKKALGAHGPEPRA